MGPVTPPGRASPVLSPAARVRAPAGSACPQGQRSVHRLAKTASWSRFGPFVYTVATLWTDVGTQECTQIGENGLLAPFWGIRVHCCGARIVRAAMRVATRAAGRCRARHRSAGLRRSAFQMNGKRLMGDSSRSCTPRRVCPIRFKALTRQSSLHTGFSALCLPAWQMA